MVSDLTSFATSYSRVLILVLMEYGLWLYVSVGYVASISSLNPCSNGIWSLTVTLSAMKPVVQMCLNPCSNGIWSLTPRRCNMRITFDCLNPCSNGIWSLTRRALTSFQLKYVLILVLMEYGLWLNLVVNTTPFEARLNPCSNGIWSLTYHDVSFPTNLLVLILVLMEYGLWLACALSRDFKTES